MPDLETLVREKLQQRAHGLAPSHDLFVRIELAAARQRRHRFAGIMAAGTFLAALSTVGSLVALGDNDANRSVAVGQAIPRGVWQEIPAAPIAGRDGQYAVWTGHEMIVWGGTDFRRDSVGYGGAGDYDDGAAYDPATKTWRTIAEPPFTVHYNEDAGGQRELPVVWTGTEMLIFGTRNSGGQNAGLAYNPATDAWRRLATPPASVGLFRGSALWTGSQVLIYGRLTDPVGADRPGGLAAYDPVADEWSERAAIPLQGREAASVTWTGSELIVWGGLYLDISSALPLGDGAAYDPQTDTWRVLPPAPIVGRHHHGAVWTGDELVIWGGWSGAVPFSDGAAYNPETDSWRRMAASPLGASAPTATIWTGHDVLVVGGDGVRVFVGGTARYDPATDVWVALESPPPVACRGQSAVWTGESVLTWGGRKDCANTGDSQATTKGLMYRP